MQISSGFEYAKVLDFYNTDNADKMMLAFRVSKLRAMALEADAKDPQR